MIPTFPDFPVTVTYARSLVVKGLFRGFDQNSKGQRAIVLDGSDARWPTRYTIALEHVRSMDPTDLTVGVTAVTKPKQRRRARKGVAA